MTAQGGDKNRIVRFEEFRLEHAGIALPRFAEKYPHPFLVLERKEGDFGEAGFQTLASKADDPTRTTLPDDRTETETEVVVPHTPVAERHADIAKRLDKAKSATYVCALVKRDVNKFASMITVGRAANNDIRLNLPSVSKFHCYFTLVQSTSSWFVTDANSSNGTFVNGEKLKSDKNRIKLENGTAVRIGPDVTARFFDTKSFYELMTGTAR